MGTRWSEDWQRNESLGFGGKNDVADARYVDDTVSLTRVYGRDCIVTRATMIYPSGIVFEPQPPTGTTSTRLDIDVLLSRKHGLVLAPTRREHSCPLLHCPPGTWMPPSYAACLQVESPAGCSSTSHTINFRTAMQATQLTFFESGGQDNAPVHRSAGLVRTVVFSPQLRPFHANRSSSLLTFSSYFCQHPQASTSLPPLPYTET